MVISAKTPTKPRTVRIIAGLYRRRLLPVLDAPGLRPTPDRVRQTAFNWLDHLLGDWALLSVVDAFAGTGALGFEAASRGAAQVLFCEMNAAAAASLRTTAAMLGAENCTVQGGDALHTLARLPAGSVDMLFLDPPFAAGWMDKVQAPAARVLAPQGLVYCESESALTWVGFEVLRHVKAGAVHAQILRQLTASFQRPAKSPLD